MASRPAVRVAGLHRVPFNKKAFDEDVKLPRYTGEALKGWRAQVRDNWDNAWIVVVEHDGPAEDIDFGAFGHGAGSRENRQAPWMEAVLLDGPNRSRAAFFLHFVDSALPLWYGKTKLEWPEVSAPEPKLLKQMKYSAPD